MLIAEWWGFEVHALVSGMLGVIPLDVMEVVMNVMGCTFMIPLALGIASSTRIGNLLGANKPERATLFFRVAVATGAIIMTVEAIIFLALHNKLGYIFSNDELVVSLVGEVVPIVCSFMVFDGLQGICSGILRGAGKQKIGAFTNVFAYWILALPVRAWLLSFLSFFLSFFLSCCVFFFEMLTLLLAPSPSPLSSSAGHHVGLQDGFGRERSMDWPCCFFLRRLCHVFRLHLAFRLESSRCRSSSS
jgi:Na+-driven multidrug efflux pump